MSAPSTAAVDPVDPVAEVPAVRVIEEVDAVEVGADGLEARQPHVVAAVLGADDQRVLRLVEELARQSAVRKFADRPRGEHALADVARAAPNGEVAEREPALPKPRDARLADIAGAG